MMTDAHDMGITRDWKSLWMPSIKPASTLNPSDSNAYDSLSVPICWKSPGPDPLTEGSLTDDPLLRGGCPLLGLLGCDKEWPYCLSLAEPPCMSPETTQSRSSMPERPITAVAECDKTVALDQKGGQAVDRSDEHSFHQDAGDKPLNVCN